MTPLSSGADGWWQSGIVTGRTRGRGARERLIEHPEATLERGRIVAAWEALERAADLLPDGHPAAPHVGRALAALEDEWRARQPSRDAADDAAYPWRDRGADVPRSAVAVGAQPTDAGRHKR